MPQPIKNPTLEALKYTASVTVLALCMAASAPRNVLADTQNISTPVIHSQLDDAAAFLMAQVGPAPAPVECDAVCQQAQHYAMCQSLLTGCDNPSCFCAFTQCTTGVPCPAAVGPAPGPDPLSGGGGSGCGGGGVGTVQTGGLGGNVTPGSGGASITPTGSGCGGGVGTVQTGGLGGLSATGPSPSPITGSTAGSGGDTGSSSEDSSGSITGSDNGSDSGDSSGDRKGTNGRPSKGFDFSSGTTPDTLFNAGGGTAGMAAKVPFPQPSINSPTLLPDFAGSSNDSAGTENTVSPAPMPVADSAP